MQFIFVIMTTDLTWLEYLCYKYKAFSGKFTLCSQKKKKKHIDLKALKKPQS